MLRCRTGWAAWARHWLLRFSVRQSVALLALIACIASTGLTAAIITLLGRGTLWVGIGIAVPVSLVIAIPLGYTAIMLIHELDTMRRELRTQATTDAPGSRLDDRGC